VIQMTVLKCTRCGYAWVQRKLTSPKRCPACNSPYWDKERVRAATVQKIVKEEKI